MSNLNLKLTNNQTHLSVAARDIEEIPDNLYSLFGTQIESLDFSYNQIKKIEHLNNFSKLRSLVMDNNEIEELPKDLELENLETLWLNSNHISDIDALIKALKTFPKLKQVSLLKNPCCPNEFTGNDSDDYKMYRLYVLHHLQNLLYLDSKIVDEKEKKEAAKRGQYCKVVTPDYQKLNSNMKPEDEKKGNEEELKPTKRDGNATYFSYTKQVYTGKNSEGNRFIKNNDL
eukprot:gene8255-79_t